MGLTLRDNSEPPSPFTWEVVQTSPTDAAGLPDAPTSWLTARDMRIFGAEPLKYEIGVVKCKDCSKPFLRSAVKEHLEQCQNIRKKGLDAQGKKRKAEEDLEDPNQSKKKKATPKIAKGRIKGPVNLDRQCGVINEKGLPCSRSLTCKSHSMGAKRAVQGRSRDYDELLLEHNRLYNPNFVEPVKKETKAEKKEKKEREKAEKKRLAAEAAAAAGSDPTAPKKSSGTGGTSASSKKKKTNAAGAAAAGGSSGAAGATQAQNANQEEEIEDIDSEEELESLVRAVRTAESHGVVGVPLAVPADASSWFVARRERLRNCQLLFASALMGQGSRGALVVGTGGRLG